MAPRKTKPSKSYKGRAAKTQANARLSSNATPADTIVVPISQIQSDAHLLAAEQARNATLATTLESMSAERYQLTRDIRRLTSKHKKQSKKTNNILHGLGKMIVDLTANGIEPSDLIDALTDAESTLPPPPDSNNNNGGPPPPPGGAGGASVQS